MVCAMLHPSRSSAPDTAAHAAAPVSSSLPPSVGLSAGRPSTVPRMDSAALLGGGREVEIAHGEAVYRLRLTAMGKLILTK